MNGTCRRCGCSPWEPCETAHRHPPGRTSNDPDRAMVERATRVIGPRDVCAWENATGICTRCHQAGQLDQDLGAYREHTYGQLAELDRIRARHGDIDVRAGAAGALIVTIPWRPRPVVIRR